MTNTNRIACTAHHLRGWPQGTLHSWAIDVHQPCLVGLQRTLLALSICDNFVKGELHYRFPPPHTALKADKCLCATLKNPGMGTAMAYVQMMLLLLEINTPPPSLSPP